MASDSVFTLEIIGLDYFSDLNLTITNTGGTVLTDVTSTHSMSELQMRTVTYSAMPTKITISGEPDPEKTTNVGKRVYFQPVFTVNTADTTTSATPYINYPNGNGLTFEVKPNALWTRIAFNGRLVDESFTVQANAGIMMDPLYAPFIELGGLSNYYGMESPPINYFSMGSTKREHGQYSLSAGINCTALGEFTQALGQNTNAFGTSANASGYGSVASGDYSHAEGYNTFAGGGSAHTEGNNTIALGSCSHAEGYKTRAQKEASHAQGYVTIADNMASFVCGKYSKAMTSGGTTSNTIGDVFVIGNGTGTSNRSNAFRISYAGQTYMTGTANTSGADYAEFFEWQDGNPDAEDRVGHFVTLDGEHIRYASQGDYILGIVSGNPAVVGNSDEDYKHRWLKDDFGRLVREYLEPSEELIDTTDMSEGDLEALRHDPDIEEREGAFYRKTEVPTDHVTKSWRYKASPDYNPDQPYTERKDRPEWDYVGMLGVLAVYDDGTCEVNSYCQCGENGIATKSSMAIAGQSFRVIKRIGPNIVKVVFR